MRRPPKKTVEIALCAAREGGRSRVCVCGVRRCRKIDENGRIINRFEEVGERECGELRSERRQCTGCWPVHLLLSSFVVLVAPHTAELIVQLVQASSVTVTLFRVTIWLQLFCSVLVSKKIS